MKISENKDNSMPYLLPSGYFESLAQSVSAKIVSQNFENESLRLDLISADTHQVVPAGYFQSMEASVIAKADSGQSANATQELISQKSYQTPDKYFEKPPVILKPKKAIPLYSNSSILTNIAATFLILVSIGALYIKPSTNAQSQKVNMASIQQSEWEHYLATEGDLNMSQGTDPLVNLDYISQKEVKEFLKEEEEYLEIF